MKRNAFAFQVREEGFNQFRTVLGQIWPEAAAILDEMGASNFSLWQMENLIFGYYETGSCRRENDCIRLSEASRKRYEHILAALKECGEWISSPSEEMRLMYQNFGIIRSSKELIRHRVFAAHLKPGMQEEYKRRHDGLTAARGEQVDPGPDSNFSIWNAGDYIFGYDEIDTSMERKPTEADRRDTIDWETHMLEIMSWCTDDVDWITGERHPHVQRLAWHK